MGNSELFGDPGGMADAQLEECRELTEALLEFRRFLPHGLIIKLETWRNDMEVYAEDLAKAAEAESPRKGDG
jgi:hypothetical protein